MNVATVFKQSTSTSARMSTNIHRTELSALSSIRFDQINKKIGNNSKSNNQSIATTKAADHSKQPSAIRKQITSAILMESNSVLNIVQEPDNEYARRHRRRLSLNVRDERLLKILSAPPDEPLYISGTANNKAATINVSDNSGTGDNLYEAATSSITAVNDYENRENENLPPPPQPTDKNVVANIEDGNALATMSSTPQKGFSSAAWNKLQRDLNSPSASCRMRAIRAINSPNGCHFYSNFDVSNDENSIDDVDRSIIMPRTIEEVMKDVVVYVEYRSGTENRTIGIKDAIANLGAKVNDKLLRNTTHVVFKDGLQSTYNKAKSWSIPIVSILWIEACKKHLVLMDPAAFPIPNIEKYENPDLYEKTKRCKYIAPDSLMKNLQRPIPKSKILEELKKCDDASTSRLSMSINKTVNCSPNMSQRSLIRKTTAGVPVKAIHSRKSLGKKLTEKPKNTIRSMFEKQFEQSRIENSQLIGTIDKITSLDINDTMDSVKTTTTEIASLSKQTEEPEQNVQEKSTSVTNSKSILSDCTLVNGSLHKRLTRRNSITIQTPTKCPPNSNTTVRTPNSITKRRRTMFTPLHKAPIDEEHNSNDASGTTAKTDETVIDTNKTVHKSIVMDICNQLNSTNEPIKTNNKVRQWLNGELPKCARDTGLYGIDGKFIEPKLRLPRRTTLTAQAMDETKVHSATSTPISLTKRRNTMCIKPNATPRTQLQCSPPTLNESKSCDAILTPTNKILESSSTFSSTPLIQSLSRTHLNHIRSSTSKSLLDEYNNTFSSKKTPMSEKRKTIGNITMDIIKQRIENINRNASFNRSTNDLLEDSMKATPTQSNDVAKLTTPIVTSETTALATSEPQIKPLKRKLFAPPSLFPNSGSPLLALTPQKTDKKTVKQKRKRDDVCGDKTAQSADKPRINGKTTQSRRSTMFFETPIRKANSDTDAIISAKSATISNANKLVATSGTLVFTSMHQPQIDFITEAVKKLGKFKLEGTVSQRTTHLVALDGRRTINMLRALIRGIWILKYDWILMSVKANRWQPELDFEFCSFSKAIEINRIERQAFGSTYRMDIFRNFGKFFIAPMCTCQNLKELIMLCYGKVISDRREARYIITERYFNDIENTVTIQLHPNWILNSITAGKVEKLSTHILKPNVV